MSRATTDGMKVCAWCGINKPVEKFHRLQASLDGRHAYCGSCKKYREKECIKERRGEQEFKKCTKCGETKARTGFYTSISQYSGLQSWCRECVKRNRRAYYEDNKHSILSRERNSRRVFKLEAIAAYGGKCECCGESRWEFLTIDHRFGNGNRHRKTVGGVRAVYREIRKQGYPKDQYRLLCFNCNCATGIFGYCPHEKERETRPCQPYH